MFEDLALAKWGGDSRSVRVLKSGLVHPYIDYIVALALALLFGNSISKQFGFLLLRLSDTTNNPNWFLDWGFSLAAAPIFVNEAFQKYKAAHLRTNDWDNNILTLLQFVNEYSLPWTVRCDYIIEEGVSTQLIDDCFRLRDNHLSRRIESIQNGGLRPIQTSLLLVLQYLLRSVSPPLLKLSSLPPLPKQCLSKPKIVPNGLPRPAKSF
jgi:hypothetical protein